MSKELPYFKFYVNEWITGDITLEDYEVQGLFINLCSYYWSKDCNLKFSMARRKFKDAKPDSFEALLTSEIIKVDKDDNLIISFLNEQNKDREQLSKTNSDNGKKGGAPKGNSNAKKTNKTEKSTQIQPDGCVDSTQIQPKTSNKEEKREEENIDDVLIQSSSVLFTINDFNSHILIGQNEFTLLAVRKTKRTTIELEELRQAFIIEQKGLSKLAWQNAADAKQHFINWANKQPTKDTPRYTPQIPN